MWFDPAQIAVSEKRPAANFANSANVQPALPKKSARLASLARLAATPELKTALQSAPRSTWWLVHYLDGAPVEVWTDPPATQTEVLLGRQDAVAAQPLHQDAPCPITACSTCAHATYRGACGEPVAAGLSDVVGVIRYSPDQGATCPAWLATLAPDLERRILAMTERWNYSGDDLATALDGARSDPDGWLRVVEADEF